MRVVWEQLAKYAPDEHALPEFFEYVRLRPEFMQLPRPEPRSRAEFRDALVEVSRRARELRNTLSDLAQGDRQDPLREISWLLNRTLAAPVGNQTVAVNPGFARLAREFDDTFLGVGEDSPSVPLAEVLTLLADASEVAATSAQHYLSRESQAERTDHVTLIRDISAFVVSRFGRPIHSAVASTLTVALQLGDDAISEDRVHKLWTSRKT